MLWMWFYPPTRRAGEEPMVGGVARGVDTMRKIDDGWREGGRSPSTHAFVSQCYQFPQANALVRSFFRCWVDRLVVSACARLPVRPCVRACMRACPLGRVRLVNL